MVLKTIAVVIAAIAAAGLAVGLILLRLRKPYSEKLALMGSIFDFGARVRGVFPPYAEGMAGAYCVHYRPVPNKSLKHIAAVHIEIPVNTDVEWSFCKKDIDEGDLASFGVSLESFQALAQMPGFVQTGISQGVLSVHFALDSENKSLDLLEPRQARERVSALARLARVLGCMAQL